MMTPTHALIAADRDLDQAERWISISRYALVYGVSRTTVYKWMRAGVVETFQAERVVRVKNQKPRTISL